VKDGLQDWGCGRCSQRDPAWTGIPGRPYPWRNFPIRPRKPSQRLCGRAAPAGLGRGAHTHVRRLSYLKLRELENPVLEMETAAIAQAARIRRPLPALRGISDNPAEPLPVDLSAVMDASYRLRVGKLIEYPRSASKNHPPDQFGCAEHALAAENTAIAVITALGMEQGFPNACQVRDVMGSRRIRSSQPVRPTDPPSGLRQSHTSRRLQARARNPDGARRKTTCTGRFCNSVDCIRPGRSIFNQQALDLYFQAGSSRISPPGCSPPRSHHLHATAGQQPVGPPVMMIL